MYFTKMKLDREAVISGRFRDLVTGPYQVHEAVWQLFADSPERTRDFLYRTDLQGSDSVVHILSSREPVYEGKVWKIDTKTYDPILNQGDILSFVIRVNPVVTKTGPDPEGKRTKIRHRYDVIMDTRRRLSEAGTLSSVTMSDIVQHESVRWLSQRGEKLGFSLFENRVIAGGYQKVDFLQGKKKNKITINVVDLEGVLKVVDPTLFLSTLHNGVGPAKGFGCGLFMIKRVMMT